MDEKLKNQQMPHTKSNGVDFFESVAAIIEQARACVGRTADVTMCVAYFEIGRMIIEEEQGGKARAEYGKELIKQLSSFLTMRFKKGFSVSTLKNARKFYQVYSPSLQRSFVTESKDMPLQKRQTMFSFFDWKKIPQKGQTMFAESIPFHLSWSHYLILMRIENPDARRFYEIEAESQQWTFRQLQRQYGSSLYERLALSRNKDKVMRLASEGQILEEPRDMLKDPLVLEFTGLEERAEYSESDLEQALIDNLQKFLLELGKGFLFESRQKRFTFDEKHFFVDLVLYNRLLQCYVLVDLKTDILKHQDLGQMQMYVNYFDRYVKTDQENPTVGILLCKEKNDSIVELTLPKDANIYSSAYSLYLPDKALLQQKLIEWTQEYEYEKEQREAAAEFGSDDE
jgi:predicted nuclease of restriction endonuclease-like (RecB) superfamily